MKKIVNDGLNMISTKTKNLKDWIAEEFSDEDLNEDDISNYDISDIIDTDNVNQVSNINQETKQETSISKLEELYFINKTDPLQSSEDEISKKDSYFITDEVGENNVLARINADDLIKATAGNKDYLIILEGSIEELAQKYLDSIKKIDNHTTINVGDLVELLHGKGYREIELRNERITIY